MKRFLNGLCDTVLKKELHTDLANALICFSHFVPLEDQVDQLTLKRFLLRGAALACRRGNPGFDLAIPIAYRSGTQQCVSAIFI